MNKKTCRRILLVAFVVFTIGFVIIPQDVAAYYEWYEYHTYSADDTKYTSDWIYWLHSEATIRYKYREDNRGRVRLISRDWYRVEHMMQMKPIDGEWWLTCNGALLMIINRGSTELWRYEDWDWYHSAGPGFAFQSGDQFRDYSTSGVYGDMINIITIP
ncbi:MAG: hypothetical protein ACFFDD_11675 [Promethearchaeota archaeon]